MLLALVCAVPFAARADSVPCDCQSCHTNPHGGGWQGCQICHQSPPATGSHAIHYGVANDPNLAYGDVSVTSTIDAYKFGCGNCHPLDQGKHMDGSVEVELYDTASPPGSIKARNPATALYDGVQHKCSDVYCHSGPTVTSGPVGAALTSPPDPVPPGYTLNGTFVMDPTCSSLTYAPYTVTRGRAYATTPAWGTSGTFGQCTECHPFPLTTRDPDVKAGVGDGHQWIDEYGYPNLHAYNMSYSPLRCRVCHYATVTAAGTTHYSGQSGDPIVYDPIPLATRVTHVNGSIDVAFDTVDPVVYRRTYSLAGASYNPATKTCSGVACHVMTSGVSRRWQSQPQWGTPYRWWEDAECDLCHRYMLSPTCTPVP